MGRKLKGYLTETVLHTFEHTIVVLPFLFLTYLLMELIEHRAGEKTFAIIGKAGRFGPLFGGLFGALPQCGFSAAASSLYSGRVITFGTLLAVYLSTSDEMVAVMLAGAVKSPENVKKLILILVIKVISAIAVGLVADLILNRKKQDENGIKRVCEEEFCCCDERGIVLSSLLHTVKIFGFILVLTFVINNIVFFIGEDRIGGAMKQIPILGEFIAGIIGLIPNCASSVIITELYLDGIITSGQMLSGLFVGAGIGLPVLFRTNRNIKENFAVLLTVYLSGVALGILISESGLASALGI